MSGLCGWYSPRPGALPLAQMAAPLICGDHAPLRTVACSLGEIALAGPADRVHLHREDGLVVAMWGDRADALARLWRSHGVKACAVLSGAFACAVFDERRGEAFLAVDRAGTRAMYYQLAGDSLAFATSADALALHPDAGHEPDPQAILDYLYLRTVGAPRSIYKGQGRLEPGQFLHLKRGRLERGRYWLARFEEDHDADAGTLRASCVQLLRDAVRGCAGQLASGVVLDGGHASAGLAAMLARCAGGTVHSFACGFEGGAGESMQAARQSAQALGTEHHERLLGPSDAADAVGALAAAFDHPLGDPAALAAFECARMARDCALPRLFSAAGGEVLFGGSARHARHARLDRYERLPSALRQLAIEPLLFCAAAPFDGAAMESARQFACEALKGAVARLHDGVAFGAHAEAAMLHPEFAERVDVRAPRFALERLYDVQAAASAINRLIAWEMRADLADRIVPLTRGASAHAGVDIAFPLLDDSLAAFAARLPSWAKRAGTGQNCLLKDALDEILPGRAARHLGPPASAPLGAWMLANERLRCLVYDSLSDLKLRRIVRADYIDELLAQRLPRDPGRHGGMAWSLMMLEQWLALRGRMARRPMPAREKADAPQTCGQ